MRELAPDVRVVEMTAEAFGLEVPDPDFRHRVDAEAAEHIVNHIDARPGEARKVALRGLLDPLVAEAVKAVRAWRRAATSAEAVALLWRGGLVAERGGRGGCACGLGAAANRGRRSTCVGRRRRSYWISLQRRPKLPLHAVLPPSRFNAPATGGERRTTMSR